MQRFVDNLRWQLTQLDLSLQPTAAPPQFDLLRYAALAKNEATNGAALLSVWVVVYPDRAVLYLYDGKEQTLRARTLSPSASPLVAAEELAIITRSAILARLEDESFEMSVVPLPTNNGPTSTEDGTRRNRATAPPPTPALPESNPRRNPSKWSGGLRASMTASFPVANHALWPGASPSAWLGFNRFRLGLGYGFYPETQVRSEQAVIALHRHPLEMNLGYELFRGRLGVLLESFATADWLRRTTLSTTVPLEPRKSSARWVASLGLRGRGEFQLGSPIALTFALGAEWVPNAFDFETSFGGQQKKLGQLSRFRPGFDLGLRWRFE